MSNKQMDYPPGSAIKAKIVAASFVLLLAGCAPLPSKDQPSSEVPAGEAQEGEHQLRITAVSELPSEPLPPTDPEVLYNVLVGEMALHAEDYEQAAQYYERAAALSKDPKIAERATRVALSTGQPKTAREAVEQWLNLTPDAERAHLAAAHMYLTGEDPELALPHLTAVVENADDTLQAWQSVAQLLVSTGLGEKSIDFMSEIMDATESNSDPDIIHLQGQLSAQLGDLMYALVLADREIALRPEAMAYAWRGRLNTIAGNEDAALADLAQAVAQDSEDEELRIQYASLLQANGQYAEAQAQLALSEVNADLLMRQAIYAVDADNLDQAEGFYNQLAELDDGDPDHRHFLLGQLAESLEREDAARSWYLLVGPGSDFAPARMRLAVLLASADRLQDAREVLVPLHHTRPVEAVDAFLLESQLLQEARQLQEAFEILNRALALFPDDVDLLYGRAIVAEQIDRVEVSERDLRRILALQPDNPTALNALGYTLADRTDRYEEAQELIAQALAMRPDEAAIVDSMGWVKFRLGELEQAESYLRRALELQFDGEIAAHLGEVLWTMGREQEAIEIWLEALQGDPENSSLLDTIERLSPGLGIESGSESNPSSNPGSSMGLGR